MLWYDLVLYGMVWYNMAWYGSVWKTNYNMAWYVLVIAWYNTVWYGKTWHGVAVYGKLNVWLNVHGGSRPHPKTNVRLRLAIGYGGEKRKLYKSL